MTVSILCLKLTGEIGVGCKQFQGLGLHKFRGNSNPSLFLFSFPEQTESVQQVDKKSSRVWGRGCESLKAAVVIELSVVWNHSLRCRDPTKSSWGWGTNSLVPAFFIGVSGWRWKHLQPVQQASPQPVCQSPKPCLLVSYLAIKAQTLSAILVRFLLSHIIVAQRSWIIAFLLGLVQPPIIILITLLLTSHMNPFQSPV